MNQPEEFFDKHGTTKVFSKPKELVNGNDGSRADEQTRLLRLAPLSAYHDRPIREREWGVQGRIPAGQVTLLSGEGGVGKTILMMQLGIAQQIREPWFGVVPKEGPFIGLFCEDDEDELHRRFAKIADHYGKPLSALTGLHWQSFAGSDAILGAPDGKGIIKPTDLFLELLESAIQIRPSIIALDNSADMYAGNENDRSQVRQFIGMLRRLAIQSGAAVMLSSHPSLTGTKSETGLSGSTAWNASMRSRLYLRRPKDEGDASADPDERVLEVKKSNYGPVGETISMRWENGLFVPTGGGHWIEKRASENQADELFLKLLDRFDKQGRNVSSTITAPTYAPALFSKDPDAISKRVKKTALADAMNRLFAANKIHVATYGRPSRPYSKIALGPHP